MGQKLSFFSACVAMLATGCVYPTERSGELFVAMDPIQEFRQGEIDTLNARVVTAAGELVPDAQIRFLSSNQTVAAVTLEGELQATGSGISVITAQAVGFENAAAAEQVVTVKKSVALDSIRPLSVRYGETVKLYGVGLNPDSVFIVNLGDAPVPDAFTWNPVDPNKPNGFGILDVWVAPPTPAKASALIVAPDGVVFGTDTLRVDRRDIYEPNDTAPRHLGALSGGFFNPALAFEQRVRENLGADWYRFDQTSSGDRTIIVASRQLSNEAFNVILTERGSFRPDGENNVVIADSAWAFGGPGLQVCNGDGFEFGYLPGQIVLLAFKDLPAGTYDVLAPYGAPGGYEMTIANGYFSFVAADADEENDICDLAKPLVPGQTKQLTIDIPHDPDWFTFTPPTDVVAVISAQVTGEGPGFLDPDLDVFVFRETPDSVFPVAESVSTADNSTDVVSSTLLAGQKYLILVTDFAGVPTRYELSMTTTAVPTPSRSLIHHPITRIRSGVGLFPTNRLERR